MHRKILFIAIPILILMTYFGIFILRLPVPAFSQTTPLTEKEIEQMYQIPNDFIGREVILAGQVFGAPGIDNQGACFQLCSDPKHWDKNTIIYYESKDFAVKSEDFVKVAGIVQGTYQGEGLSGSPISAPKIQAGSIEQSSYIDIFSPTKKSIDVNSTQTQYGYEVTLQKVEFSDSETRVYVSVVNNGKSNVSVYSFFSKIGQDDKQYEEQPNYNADYQQLQTDLVPGAKTQGIIVFPALKQSDCQVILKAFSDNWTEKMNPYTFDIATG